MNILIEFEYSGIVRDAFIKRGHNAISGDLLPTETGGGHYQEDVFKTLNRFKKGDLDLIGLHIPCTAVGLCGNRHYGVGCPKHNERIKAIAWTKKVLKKALSICDKVYYENPKNVMGSHIGKRTQVIQPYQFGHPEQKETWLWLYGLPPLIETKNVYNKMMKLTKQQRERIFRMPPSATRGLERSRTYTGIANAMAKQWG